ncbi:hypothetical protein BKA93DRAFT_753499 [Sparassis latifolia]
MKSLVTVAASIASAFAQTAWIGIPAAGSNLTAGSPLNVTVSQSPPMLGFNQVALVIAMQQCPASGCSGYNPYYNGLGVVLYQGPFTPTVNPEAPWLTYHENFAVQVPASYSGAALLEISQFELVGNQSVPYWGIQNVTVNVV